MTQPRKAPSKYLTGAPDHVAAIYDNGGKSFDRYIVIYTDYSRGGIQPARGMSEHPFHPQGFGQMTEAMRGSHLGKLIIWADLPPDCQRLVIQDGREE